jgi:hypothetical protein
MSVNFDVEDLNICPICNSKEHLYVMTIKSIDGESYSVGCTHCEIDTYQMRDRQAVIDRWNSLPRKTNPTSD